MPEKQNKRLVVQVEDETLTKEDFASSFENVVNLVLQREKQFLDALERMEKLYNDATEKMKGEQSVALGDLRKQVDEVFVGRQVEAMVKEHRERMMMMDERMSGMMSEHKDKMMMMDERMAKIRNGQDGRPGMKGDKPIKGIDYLSVSEVKGIVEEAKKGVIEELRGQRLNFGGGGGFSKIAMDSHIIDDETPTGTKNGVNTVFTLAHTPVPETSLKVYRGGARQRLTEDYTLSGKTITFTSAPASGEIILCDYRT